MTDHSEPSDSLQTGRKATMAAVARATTAELAGLDAMAGDGVTVLRTPEIGLVMVRGRIGGDGAPFNMGEATVTRVAVSLPGGEVGFGHVLGRDKEKARLAALADALWQAPATRDAVEALLAPVRERLADEAACKRERAAATRVDFFTMVRGDN